MEPLTVDHVQVALDALDLGIQIQIFEDSTATAQEAADAIGTSLGSIAKSLVFVVNGEPIVVITAGDQKVDTRKIAMLYGVGRKKVKTAPAEACIQHVGYAPGGVPPIGHRETLPIYVDQTLNRFETVYAAGGTANAIFPIAYATLIAVTGGQLADVVVESETDST